MFYAPVYFIRDSITCSPHALRRAMSYNWQYICFYTLVFYRTLGGFLEPFGQVNFAGRDPWTSLLGEGRLFLQPGQTVYVNGEMYQVRNY